MNKSKNKFRAKKLLFLFLPVVFCGTYTEGKYYVDPDTCLRKVNHFAQKKIVVQILDEHGKPKAVKISVTELDSVYHAPDGHLSDFKIAEHSSNHTHRYTDTINQLLL